MKIDLFKRRAASAKSPLEGVTFHAADEKAARELARQFVDFKLQDVNLLRAALGRQIMFLDELADWTPEGEYDEDRRKQRDRSLVLYHALTMANARIDRAE